MERFLLDWWEAMSLVYYYWKIDFPHLLHYCSLNQVPSESIYMELKNVTT